MHMQRLEWDCLIPRRFPTLLKSSSAIQGGILLVYNNLTRKNTTIYPAGCWQVVVS